MHDSPHPTSSPAAFLALGLGSGSDSAEDDADDAELSAFLCAIPDLELHGCLGQGGMGRVYRARQLRLDRIVAVKLMHAELGQQPEFRERFEREARALARLDHPNIVRVHDFGELGGVFYLIMEHVDGISLRSLIQRGVDASTARRVVEQLCDALDYAHGQGVVHRDIKPENVLISSDGVVKIADFGLAKLQETEALAQTRRIVGTPQYMAPEQLRDPSSVDHRADVFAIGVVLYEMLTGHVPVGRFPAPSELGHGDPNLDTVVLRALESNRDRRYQTTSELRTALEAHAEPAVTKHSTRIRNTRTTWGLGAAIAVAVLTAGYWSTRTPPADVRVAAPVIPNPAAQVSGAPTTATELPAANRWPVVELAAIPERVGAIVGIDWTELQQAPALAKLDAVIGDDPSWIRCREDVVSHTHKLLVVFDHEGAFAEAIAHGDWESEALEGCLRVFASHARGDDTGIDIHREALGPHTKFVVSGPELGRESFAVGKDGRRIIVQAGDVQPHSLTQRFERSGHNDIAQRVAPSTDLDAPLWVLSDSFPSAWHPALAGVSGHLDVWDNLEARVVVRFTAEDEAARAAKVVEGYATVAANLTDMPLNVTTELRKTELRVHATMPIPEDLFKASGGLRPNAPARALGIRLVAPE